MNSLYKFLTFLLFFVFNGLVSTAGDYYVYSDKLDNGSPSGIMGSQNGKSLTFDPFCKENPLKGENCLKITASGEEDWSGVFFQQGNTWKDGINASIPLADLTGKKYLVVSARSDKSYTLPKLGMGEGKEPKKEEAKLLLTSAWQRFVFELPPGQDYTRVNGLLLVVFEKAGVLFLDEVFYAGDGFTPQATDIVFKERQEPLDPTSFYIFADKFENGIPSGYMGDKNGMSIKLDDTWKVNPYLGTKCMKFTIDKSESWRGLYILYTGSWNAAVPEGKKVADLSGFDKLEFYARADVKSSEPYLISEIGTVAGVKTEEKRADSYVEVGPTWKKYTISLKGMDLKEVNHLLFMVLQPGTLYLDEVRFLKKK